MNRSDVERTGAMQIEQVTQTGHSFQDSNTGSPTLKGNTSQCFGGDMDLIELIKSTTSNNNHTFNVNGVPAKGRTYSHRKSKDYAILETEIHSGIDLMGMHSTYCLLLSDVT